MKQLDPILVATIQQATLDKVAANEMFTAFDVSRTVQTLGHRERHNNMKHVVHELFESGGISTYDRTLVTVEPGKPEAWVYHPAGTDPNQYKPVFQPLPSTLTPAGFYGNSGAPTPTKPTLSSVSFAPPQGGPKGIDQRGALLVPAKLVQQIGGKPGDQLDVVKENDTLVISTDGVAGRKYTVNGSSNIRMRRRTWSPIVSGSNGDFSFEERGGKIIVTHK